MPNLTIARSDAYHSVKVRLMVSGSIQPVIVLTCRCQSLWIRYDTIRYIYV